MIQLHNGMKVHAKKVDLHIDGTVLTYSAPRGKKFALILMAAEDPQSPPGVCPDEFLREMGWDHADPEA